MSELNIKILQLMNENKTYNQITDELKITARQLLIHLNQLLKEGYCLKYYYYDNGNILVKLNKNLISNSNVKINLKNSSTFHFLAISDLHIGDALQNLSYLDQIYEYAKKNNIHSIINLGDLMAGTQNKYKKNKLSIESPVEQANYVIKNYPKDKEILNYILYGDHDLRILSQEGIDVSKIISQRRHDLINVGKMACSLPIEKDFLQLVHKAYSSNIIPSNIVLIGHSHSAQITEKHGLDNTIHIKVPTLSDLICDYDTSISGAYDMRIEFKDGFFNRLIINQLIFTPKLLKANELIYNIGQEKTYQKK